MNGASSSDLYMIIEETSSTCSNAPPLPLHGHLVEACVVNCCNNREMFYTILFFPVEDAWSIVVQLQHAENKSSPPPSLPILNLWSLRCEPSTSFTFTSNGHQVEPSWLLGCSWCSPRRRELLWPSGKCMEGSSRGGKCALRHTTTRPLQGECWTYNFMFDHENSTRAKRRALIYLLVPRGRRWRWWQQRL